MFLAKKINKRISQLSLSLQSRRSVGHDELADMIYEAIKPFGAKVEVIKADEPASYFVISGYFEPERRRQPITIQLHFSDKTDRYRINRGTLNHTMFVLFQTMCHELIHKYQSQFRESSALTWYYELDDKAEMSEDQTYYAEVDEIDAYAHDIALELIFMYPKTCMKKLNSLASCKQTSYQFYLKVFRDCKWSDIRKQLLKKTYQHIIQIQEKKEHYAA